MLLQGLNTSRTFILRHQSRSIQMISGSTGIIRPRAIIMAGTHAPSNLIPLMNATERSLVEAVHVRATHKTDSAIRLEMTFHSIQLDSILPVLRILNRVQTGCFANRPDRRFGPPNIPAFRFNRLVL